MPLLYFTQSLKPYSKLVCNDPSFQQIHPETFFARRDTYTEQGETNGHRKWLSQV